MPFFKRLAERREQQREYRAKAAESLRLAADLEKTKLELELARARRETAESGLMLEQIKLATETVATEYALAKEIYGKNIFNEDDKGVLFDLFSYATGDAIDEANYLTMLRNAYQAWSTDAFAHGWIEVFVKFVVGMSCKLRQKDGDEAAQAVLDEFMDGYTRQDGSREQPWEKRANEWVRRTFRDECFVRKFPRTDGRTYLRFLNPMWVRSAYSYGPVYTYGIITDPDDIEKVIAYRYWPFIFMTNQSVEPQQIPARNVIHTKLTDSDAKRSRPLLLPVMADLVEFNRLLRARRKLHWLRTLFALEKRVKGAWPALLKAKHDKAKVADPNNPTGLLEYGWSAAGIIEHNDNVEYEFKTPQLQAQDALADIQVHGAKILAGLGLSPTVGIPGIYQETYNQGELSESPMITTMKMWQGFFACDFARLAEDELRAAQAVGRLDSRIPAQVAVDYPLMNPRDMEKETRAMALQQVMGAISLRTARGKLDLDDVIEQKQIELEQSRLAAVPGHNGSGDGEPNMTDAELAAMLSGPAGRNGKGNEDKIGLVPKSVKRLVTAR
jgi:hypothetical protein